MVNLVIDNFDGGYQAGKYFRELGHKKALCISDNYVCMDKVRIEGFKNAFAPGETFFWRIPELKKERGFFYEKKLPELLSENITAVFAVSDYYALDFMAFLQEKGVEIPGDIQVIGFDDSIVSKVSNPSLTTVRQDPMLRAKTAIECIEAMRDGRNCNPEIILPVELIKRQSTGEL